MSLAGASSSEDRLHTLHYTDCNRASWSWFLNAAEPCCIRRKVGTIYIGHAFPTVPAMEKVARFAVERASLTSFLWNEIHTERTPKFG